MKTIFSILLSSLVFALKEPVAYGQQLGNTVNTDTPINQTTTTDSPDAIIAKSENLTITDQIPCRI